MKDFGYVLSFFYFKLLILYWSGARGKEPACQCRRCERSRFDPWVEKIPWRRAQQPAPVALPGESHGQRSLADYSPWGCGELDMTEQLTLSRS